MLMTICIIFETRQRTFKCSFSSYHCHIVRPVELSSLSSIQRWVKQVLGPWSNFLQLRQFWTRIYAFWCPPPLFLRPYSATARCSSWSDSKGVTSILKLGVERTKLQFWYVVNNASHTPCTPTCLGPVRLKSSVVIGGNFVPITGKSSKIRDEQREVFKSFQPHNPITIETAFCKALGCNWFCLGIWHLDGYGNGLLGRMTLFENPIHKHDSTLPLTRTQRPTLWDTLATKCWEQMQSHWWLPTS